MSCDGYAYSTNDPETVEAFMHAGDAFNETGRRVAAELEACIARHPAGRALPALNDFTD